MNIYRLNPLGGSTGFKFMSQMSAGGLRVVGFSPPKPMPRHGSRRNRGLPKSADAKAAGQSQGSRRKKPRRMMRRGWFGLALGRRSDQTE